MPRANKSISKIIGQDTFEPIDPGKPKLNILFYTDAIGSLFDVEDNTTSIFGVGRLRELIETNIPSYVDIDIRFVDRHGGGDANHLFTDKFLAKFDEVWFFGTKLSNTTGHMRNELTQHELLALRSWMKAGGVLMAGDHANPRSPDADPSLNDLLNLGRAIGHGVPRAGQLRRWDGVPGIDPPDNYDTNELPEHGLASDSDKIPQRLILKKYGLGKFSHIFALEFRPHPLFCGKAGPIEVFPDHMHEGHLIIPEPLDADWPTAPNGFKPSPEIIARGIDKRNGNVYGIVSAYDGDAASVGRIVADSTWHHYFNINLIGFPCNSDGSPGEVLAKLAVLRKSCHLARTGSKTPTNAIEGHLGYGHEFLRSRG